MKISTLLAAASIFTAPVFAAPPILNWDGSTTSGGSYNQGGTDTWDNATTNWDTGAAFQSWVAGDIANFAGAAGTVTLNAPINAGGLTFNTSGYTLTGNTLTLAAANNIEVAGSGTATIASVIAGSSGLSVNGSGGTGTLVLSGANTVTGTVNVNAGTLTSAAASTAMGSFLGGPGAADARQTVNIASGAVVSYTNTAANGFLRTYS